MDSKQAMEALRFLADEVMEQKHFPAFESVRRYINESATELESLRSSRVAEAASLTSLVDKFQHASATHALAEHIGHSDEQREAAKRELTSARKALMRGLVPAPIVQEPKRRFKQ